jgi:FemAB-related protein (PEP-CTERM system-associated)
VINGSPRISVTELAAGDYFRWDEFVTSCPEGTFFHLSGWKRVIEKEFGYRTYYLLAQRDNVVAGVLPLTHVKSRLFGSRLVSNAFATYGGPVAEDDESRRALEDQAVELMEKLGVPTLEMRTVKPHRSDWPTKSDLYVTFRRPIDPSLERNLKSIPRKQRAMVRKGIRNELRSEIDDAVDRLYRIYAESVHNLGTPVFSKSYFRILREEFATSSDIVTVSSSGRAIASVLNFYFRDQVLPYYGGGRCEARTLAANDFMYWEVIRRGCERGCRLFDFGRSKVGTGSYAFKQNWGFEATPLAYQYRLTEGQQIPELNPLNPKYRLFIAAWKQIPLPVSKLLGPAIVRQIG